MTSFFGAFCTFWYRMIVSESRITDISNTIFSQSKKFIMRDSVRAPSHRCMEVCSSV